MTRTEHVTDFKLDDDKGQPITLSAVVKGINQHLKPILDGESFFDSSAWAYTEAGKTQTLPARWRSLIAFSMEGDNEGYYVHIGVMVSFSTGMDKPGEYIDMGHAKLWSPEHAQKVATEAQRFLTAARWN